MFNYYRIHSYPYTINFPNTFIDKEHVKECLSNDNVVLKVFIFE